MSTELHCKEVQTVRAVGVGAGLQWVERRVGGEEPEAIAKISLSRLGSETETGGGRGGVLSFPRWARLDLVCCCLGKADNKVRRAGKRLTGVSEKEEHDELGAG